MTKKKVKEYISKKKYIKEIDNNIDETQFLLRLKIKERR